MIEVIDVNKFLRDNQCLGPVISSQLFVGKSQSFHPQGLLSEDYFGIYGSPDRRESCSWIELNCKVMHPALFDIIQKRIERKIDTMLSGEKAYKFGKNDLLEEDPDGELTGMSSFSDNITKIRFRLDENEDSDRNKIISMLYKNISRETFFMDKLIVIPPDFRPVTVMEESGEVMVDELNELYQKIIILSNQVKSVSGSLYDILTYRMQLLVKEVNEFVRRKVAKKGGMIRGLMLGKRVDFSARSVIAPNPTLNLGEVGIPLRILCQIFEPFMLYGLVNSPDSRYVTKEFHQEVKKFLGKEKDIDIDM